MRLIAPDDPVKLILLKVRNSGDRPRKLSATFFADASSRRGFATCTPSEVVRKAATPRSMPMAEPVGESGRAGTS